MNTDNRQARTEATRNSLMRAAEKLFAEHGVENVTVRAIIEQSGQKNESALQYHFGSRQGLIDAIHQHRNAQARTKRSELLDKLLARSPDPDLREICGLMVEAPLLLARSDPGFRRWVRAFGQELATLGLPALRRIQSTEIPGTQEFGRLLRASLGHLDNQVFQHRFDSAVRFAGLAMSQHARKRRAFRGPDSEVFFNMLVDALTGLLAADISEPTRKALATASSRRS